MTLHIFWSMALLTVQRSPSSSGPALTELDGVAVSPEEDEEEKAQIKAHNRQRSISECYFAMKGAALVLPQNECINSSYRKSITNGGDIQQHLQSMFYLLRAEDTLKMAVKLESLRENRMRYLVVVSCIGNQNMEESCLLGVDCNEKTTLGLVLAVWADVKITLDGDGGFSVSSNSKHHIFKPVSVQAMWSALQTLHKASDKATGCNFFHGGITHGWVESYETKINSDRSCLNEWHAMDDLESRRPPSPDYRRFQHQRDPEVTERNIKSKLREVMMTVDLDEVTSKHIRTRLEQDLHMDLQEYKSFIDQEMLTIMGQMDTSTEIFDHLYLGSEWNASNLEELQRNGVGHILNVTREIDNFFPGMFDYLNIRVYDEEGTELLKHWDTTYKFITDAKEKGSKVLVHCKMGVSRSASVVMAYIMKANNWKLNKAFEFVKVRRNCVQPNQSFMKQLETYQGILDASNHRHNTLWRSKSENNLKKQEEETTETTNANTVEKTEEQPPCSDIYLENQNLLHRPKSWSPDENIADMLFSENVTDSPNISKNHVLLRPACLDGVSYSVSPNKALHLPLPQQQSEPIRFAIGSDDSPVSNDDSVSGDSTPKDSEDIENESGSGIRLVKRVSSIKDRINELEFQAQLSELKPGTNRDWLDIPESTGLVLNLASQFESVSKSNPSSPVEDIKCELSVMGQPDDVETVERPSLTFDIQGSDPVISQTKLPATKLQAVLVRPETWNNKSADILRANSETLLNVSADQTNEIRRRSTDDLQCCKSEGDVIMRLRVNNEDKDLTGGISAKGTGEILGKKVDTTYPILKSFTQEINTPVLNNSKVINSYSDLPPRSPESVKRSEIFTTNLDNVFCKEEQNTALNKVLSCFENCDEMKKVGECASSDSAINLQSVEKSLSNETAQKSSAADTVTSVYSLCSTNCISLDSNSKFGVLPSDLNKPHVWPTGVVKIQKKDEVKVNSEDCLLKRVCSLDGSLPSRSNCLNKAQQQTVGQIIEGASDIPLASVIQRSQSLRNSATSGGTPKVVRIHGPKPYKSPSDKQVPFLLDGATIMANEVVRSTGVEGGIVHYASAPILYKDSTHDHHPTVPKAASSQPNITTSCLIINSPNNIASKMPLKLDLQNYNEPAEISSFDAGNESDFNCKSTVKSGDIEVPLCSGIVKQHKEVLESKIASSSSILNKSSPKTISVSSDISEQPHPSPPLSTDTKQQCDKAEEWKILQHKIQLQMQSDAPDDGSPPGKVKRITRQMELATGSTVLPAPVMVAVPGTTTALLQGSDVRPDLIILDQNGKEVTPELHQQSTFTQGAEGIPSSIVMDNLVCSPVEDKSVKSLVGKFEKPLRTRYYSETEVENLAWNESIANESLSNDISSVIVLQEGGVVSCSQDEPYAHYPITRKRGAECEMFGQSQSRILSKSPKEINGSEPNVSVEDKTPENQNAVHCVKNNWLQHRPPLNPFVIGASSDDMITVNGVLHRKVRKAQGKSHPLSKLQNANKQRHVNPVYYTM